MKTALCYFTGTGNSLFAAQTVAEQLGSCQIFKLYDVCKNIRLLDSFDRVGIFFPVYSLGLPSLVEEFANCLDSDFSGKYFFGVLTSGGFPGDAAKQLCDILEKNGVDISYTATISMPYSNVVSFPCPSTKIIESTLNIASRRLSVVAADIAVGMVQKPSVGAKAIKAVGSLFGGDDKERDKKFILTAACDGCAKCAELCPVKNIKMVEGKPEFQHNCEFCLGCFNRCPQGAINYGRKTIKKTRYINPLVKLED